MRKEYDFSKGEQGKFFIPKDEIDIPVYLDKDVRKYFATKAKKENKDIDSLINSTLKKDMELAE